MSHLPHRKESNCLNYVAHAIFTLHLYIFVFIVVLFEIGISEMNEIEGLAWLQNVNDLLTIAIIFYLYKEQRILKTIMKYGLFLFSFTILIIFFFIIFAWVSVFQI